jgi:hypothetical protein
MHGQQNIKKTYGDISLYAGNSRNKKVHKKHPSPNFVLVITSGGLEEQKQ